jgi:hypothetical protein
MNERERADIVARAIDALLDGAALYKPPVRANGEFQSLIEIARERLRASLFIARASLQHEHTIWRSVLDRIQNGGLEAVRSEDETSADNPDEFAEVIAMRMRLADNAARLAEDHRQEVWERIQSKLSDTSRYSSVPHILRPLRRRFDAPPAIESGTTARPSHGPAAIPPTIPRLAAGYMAESTQEMARERVWARATANVASPRIAEPDERHTRKRPAVPSFALAAAAAVITILALGPLPATGFADHPAARFAVAISDYIGASEGTPPPLAQLPPLTFVNGTSASVGEASQVAGIGFGEPDSPPLGFELKSSQYYPVSISGGRGGTFALMYSSSDATLMIYQEQAGGANLVTESGTMTLVTLADGTAATLIEGSWASGETPFWSDNSSQALLFERAGVRTIVELQSPQPAPSLLFETADSLH